MTLPLSLLAIDLGAESGRAIVGSLDHERLTLSEVHRFPNVPVRLAEALYWDVLRIWDEIQSAIVLASRKCNREIASIGVDTWGVDFGLLDAHGTLIANPVHYRDNRTDGMMEQAFRRMPRERIFELTGIQFMQLNTLYQLLSLVERKSPVLEIARTLLTMPDLFNYWLTGQIQSEFSIATTTQCYDPRRQAWSEPLLQAMGIPCQIFPRVVPPGTKLGKLCPPLNEAPGLAEAVVIAPACHDTGSAVAAVPAKSEDFSWISSGTWSIMGAEMREPVINAASLSSNFTNEGGVNGTFRFSKNIAGLWLVQECRRTWAAEGEELTYTELTQMAAQASPLVSIVDPEHEDFLKPGDMPKRIRAYCERTNQPAQPESKGAIVRCALESVALKYRWVLEQLESMLGHRLEPIHIVGGGTQNRLLSQFAADATGRTVISGPVEATAIGNILVQAIALGAVGTLQDARALVRRSFIPEVFEPGSRAGWDDAYGQLVQFMKQSSQS